jgi:hypothetical protein
MPIHELETIEGMEIWLSNFAKPDRYIIYVTSANEVVAQPSKTSRPLIYGYIKVADIEKLKMLLRKIKDAGYTMIKIKTFSWDTECVPGIRAVREE